mmetsp:Transcript_71571/g.207235  ORF Transcript_71571/g.207235 Transcript_71571/m.207235 type:complete len:219 (+) Transcript_71571:2510-3166(+)
MHRPSQLGQVDDSELALHDLLLVRGLELFLKLAEAGVVDLPSLLGLYPPHLVLWRDGVRPGLAWAVRERLALPADLAADVPPCLPLFVWLLGKGLVVEVDKVPRFRPLPLLVDRQRMPEQLGLRRPPGVHAVKPGHRSAPAEFQYPRHLLSGPAHQLVVGHLGFHAVVPLHALVTVLGLVFPAIGGLERDYLCIRPQTEVQGATDLRMGRLPRQEAPD